MTQKEHDPGRQISYLQQCLSSDKKPLGLFLGAGCPTAIVVPGDKPTSLIPDISGITDVVRDGLSKDSDCCQSFNTLEGNFKKDGLDSANVEEMLSYIRALRAVAGNEEVRGLSAVQLDKLDDSICGLIHELADKTLPNNETPYHHVASWVDAFDRQKPVEIFTTNYDLLLEQALEDCRVPYFDGFAGAHKPFFDLRALEEDMLPPRWARLWKLHGSINWYQVTGKGVFRGGTKAEQSSRRVIHPSHLKYEESRRMPYLAMIDRLRAFLRQPTAALIICGYSFRDEHLNEVIIQGLQGTPSAIAFALMFGEIVKYPAAASLARQRPNLSLLARDAAIISGSMGKWCEKEAEAVPPDYSKWVNWMPLDPANKNSKQKAQFLLGDFTVFGQFVHELTGAVRQQSGVLGAE